MLPQPTTEPVRVRRDRPLAAGLAAVAVIVVLVAKPWETPAPVASPLAAISSASPSATALPTPPQTSEPTPARTPAPLPTADIAPLEPLGEFALAAPPESAFARCTYTRVTRGGVRRLRGVEVLPPRVTLDSDARTHDIRRVSWRFELEMNRRERLFDRAWVTVDESARQSALTVAGRPANFTPLSVRYQPTAGIEQTSLFRVRVIVEWHTRNFELAGRAEAVANRYQEGRNERLDSWPMFCSGVRPAR